MNRYSALQHSLSNLINNALSMGIDNVGYGIMAFKSFELWLKKIIDQDDSEDYENAKRNLIRFEIRWLQNIFRKHRHKLCRRIHDIIEGLCNLDHELLLVNAKLSSRGIIGLGSGYEYIAYEVGVNIDPYLCVPFIPGSEIKGALRHSLLYILAVEGKCSSINECVRREEVVELFGNRPGETSYERLYQGKAKVFDAYVTAAGVKDYILYPDVITPHYTRAPTEFHVKPVPIPHLVIAPGTIFTFIVSYLKGSLSNEAKSYLKKSLLMAFHNGIGARTSIGYSIFEPIPNNMTYVNCRNLEKVKEIIPVCKG